MWSDTRTSLPWNGMKTLPKSLHQLTIRSSFPLLFRNEATSPNMPYLSKRNMGDLCPLHVRRQLKFLQSLRVSRGVLSIFADMATWEDPDELVVCPYDPVHLVQRKRFQYHLIKCRKVRKARAAIHCIHVTITHSVPSRIIP